MEAYSQVHETTNDLFEEVENWVNSLLEEGYDLSDYTWEEMYEAYIEENTNDGIGSANTPAAAAQLRQRSKNIQARGGGFGQIGRGLTRMFGSGEQISKLDAEDKADRAREKAALTGASKTKKPERQGPYVPDRLKKAPPTTPPSGGSGGSGGSAKSTAPRSAAPKQTTTPATAKPTDGAERRTPTSAELRSAQSARSSALAAGKTKPEAEKSAVQAGVDRGTKLMGGPEGPGKIDTSSVQRDLAKANAPKPSTPSTPSSTATAKPSAPSLQQSIRNRRLNMDLDLFDLVKGYLLDEGYAETEEGAMVMMVNMSEGWRESILESCGVQLGESQHARENPEDHDKEEKKKYEKVRGEKTPMPPRGDKRREDFEKWYAANVR
jgi:hypothetical protein